jgi:hypothetical protein
LECPVCGKVSRPEWQWVYFSPYDREDTLRPARQEKHKYEWVGLDWMRCAHEECEQLIVRVHEARVTGRMDGAGEPVLERQIWVARPRFGEVTREVAAEVPEPFRNDYLEAAALLDLSPRMSAVLSRSILADLMEKYLDLTDFGLNERINKFRTDSQQPQRLRDGAHHFREIGDFGSHTQRNDQDQIIPVDRGDAEWMLGYLDRFLEYYVVSPERDRLMLGKWDKNIADAGRKSIRPLSDDEDSDDAGTLDER